MKRTVLTILIIVAVLSCAAAQEYSTKSKAAIKLYQNAKMTVTTGEKISLLEKAIAKDKKFEEAYFELARTYINLDSFELSVALLEKIYELNPTDNVRLRLSEAYYRNAQYGEAVDMMSEIESSEMKNKLKNIEHRYKNALRMYNNPVDFKPKRLEGVSTKYDDYAPSVTADGKMMSTTVLNPIYGYAGDERMQEDMYISFSKPDGGWTFSRPLAEPLNTPNNEGAQSFSADGRYMFYVICNHPDNIGSCDIYYSIKMGNKWSKPMNLGAPANTEYWETNPVMSPSGDELYLVSNRPGGLGGSDIWKVKIRILKDGRLEPYKDEPLGAPVNTEGDEYTPFIHADGITLYYSSTGLNGMGGSDIYVTTKKLGMWSTPKNLGYPINTNGNESGFVVNGKGDKAYYASNKINPEYGTGLDIYEIDMPEEAKPLKMLFSPGRVTDASNGKPLNAYVEIFDQSTNNKIFESMSDRIEGDFVAFLPEGGSYGLSVRKDGYLFYTKEIKQAGDSILVAMQPIVVGNVTRVDNLFFDTDKDRILAKSYAVIEHLYDFLKQNPKVKIEIVGHTDNVGQEKHNQDLSERRAASLKRALVDKGIVESRISTHGEGSSKPVASNATEEGRAQNRRVEVVIK